METNPFLRSEIGNVVQSRTEIYNNLQLELDLVESRLSEIERAMTSLANGKLDKNIIGPGQLRQTLTSIQYQLPDNYTLMFNPAGTYFPRPLQSVMIFMCVLSSSNYTRVFYKQLIFWPASSCLNFPIFQPQNCLIVA